MSTEPEEKYQDLLEAYRHFIKEHKYTSSGVVLGEEEEIKELFGLEE